MIRPRNAFAALTIAALLALSGAGAASASASVPHYKNCTAMHVHYKHGVAKTGARDHVKGKSKPDTRFYRSTAIYNANKGLDRDKDGVACEA
ncbi:MAG TPA: excalibur calcium-binding domain-containing protein [Galbitalea sp.]|jgi:hypothetical protein